VVKKAFCRENLMKKRRKNKIGNSPTAAAEDEDAIRPKNFRLKTKIK
jgi:hypothetical protein